MNTLTSVQFAPTLATMPILEVSSPAAGSHSCTLFVTGRFVCWGSNPSGAVGLDSASFGIVGDDTGETLTLAPVAFAATITHLVVQVATGSIATCGTINIGRRLSNSYEFAR